MSIRASNVQRFNTGYVALSHMIYSVPMFPVTMIVGSNTRTLLSPLVRPCPTFLVYLVTFTSYTHVTLSYDTLIGMDRFTLRRAKRGDIRATP
jgi:hypothetical protein